MSNPILKTCLALTIASISAQSFANGLAINEQSASGAGTAYAGRSSSALDASTVYGNPAGMAKLTRTEFSGGMAVVKADVDINHVRSTASGTNKGDMAPLASVPFGYFVTPLDEHWSFGFGFYVPFGVISDYEKSFQGSSHGLHSKVRVITAQPTISYKLNDKFAVGLGATINRIDGKLTNTLATGFLNNGIDTRVHIKGDDIAYGYNLGFLISPTERTSFGLTYHSKVEYKLEGYTRINGLPNLPGLPLGQLVDGKYDAKLDITMPESIDISMTHKLDDRWTIYAGGVWTRWSRLEKLEVNNSGMNAMAGAMFGTIGEELKWKDTWAFSLGTAYQLNKEWVLRTGLALDPSPTTNEHRNVRIPVGNRKVFTLGAGWSPNDDLTIDLAYAYIWENTAGVNQPGKPTNIGGNTIDLQPAYSAKYDITAHALAAQMTYRF